MEAAADADPRGKRDPRDFALWKGRKADEPESAAFPSPVGRRPPRLAHRVLRDVAALPRRRSSTSTAAASTCASRTTRTSSRSRPPPATRSRSYWVHNGLVNVNGQKMSKSLGNSVYAADLLGAARPLVVRYYLGSAHYRSTIDFHDGSLGEAEAALDRIAGFLERVDRRLAGTRFAGQRRRGRPGRVRRGDGRRPRRSRRRSPCCTRPCAQATPRSTRKTWRPRPPRAGRCSR